MHGDFRQRCTACRRGVPNEYLTICVLWTQIKNPIKDCDIGVANKGNEYSCGLCLKGKTYSWVSKKCEYVLDHEGCLEVMENKGRLYCLSCNVYAGYTMKSDGKCHNSIKKKVKKERLDVDAEEEGGDL